MMQTRFYSLLLSALLWLVPIAASADDTRIFFAPGDNLERIDVQSIRQAKQRIDMAAYVLTSFAVIDALETAARNRIKVRIVLEPTQIRKGSAAASKLEALARIPGIEIRTRRRSDIMHLKAYLIDRTLLRTGSANFSPSGLKRQNNDLLLTSKEQPVSRYQKEFEQMWSAFSPWP